MQTSKLKFLRSAFTAAALLLVLFSLIFTTVKADHHCACEDCPVCVVINLVRVNLKLLVIAFFALKAVRSFKKAAFQLECLIHKQLSSIYSLIILKTRLND